MEITFTPFFFFVGLRNLSSPGAEWEGTLSFIIICVASIAYYHYFKNFTGLSGLLLQVGHIWMGRRCRWIHKEKPSIWTSMETYISTRITFMSMVQKLGNNIIFVWQEEISGWREDLFTARKSAMNLLGVLAMSKVKKLRLLLTYFSYLFIGSYRLWSISYRDHQYLLQIKLPQLHVSGRKVKRAEEITKDAWVIYWCFHFCQSFLCLREVTYWMLVLQ